MPFPSLRRFRDGAVSSARRFPLVIASGVCAFVTSEILIHEQRLMGAHRAWVVTISRSLPAELLGLSLLLAVSLTVERGWTRAKRGAALALTVAALTLFGCASAWMPQGLYAYCFWYGMVAAHLWVAVAPYAHVSDNRAVWAFNRILFLRVLSSLLYSVTLYAGLAIALSAVDHLLGLKINSERYFDLWCFIAMVFNTWYFASGIPGDWRALSDNDAYPQSLLTFVQFVLIPLAVIYMAILYAYMGKIVFIHQWPKGTIGWLVSIISILGTFCWLLLHPLRERAGHGWISLFARWFFRGLIPLLALLLMALYRRISEYGITEDRYILVVLCLWMMAMALWYMLRPGADLRALPVSLAALAVAAAVGPWSSFSVSRHSQLNRLRSDLESSGILVQGMIVPAKANIPWKTVERINHSIDYFLSMHGAQSLRPLLGEMAKNPTPASPSLVDVFVRRYNLAGKDDILKKLGLTAMSAAPYGGGAENNFYYNANTAVPTFVDIRGFMYEGHFNAYIGGVPFRSNYVVNRDTYTLAFSTGSAEVSLLKNAAPVAQASLRPFILHLLGTVMPGSALPSETLVFDFAQGDISVRLIFETLSGQRNDSAPVLNSVAGLFLLKT